MSRSRLVSLAALAAVAVLFGTHGRFAWSQSEGSELIILSSASIHGELAPCG